MSESSSPCQSPPARQEREEGRFNTSSSSLAHWRSARRSPASASSSPVLSPPVERHLRSSGPPSLAETCTSCSKASPMPSPFSMLSPGSEASSSSSASSSPVVARLFHSADAEPCGAEFPVACVASAWSDPVLSSPSGRSLSVMQLSDLQVSRRSVYAPICIASRTDITIGTAVLSCIDTVPYRYLVSYRYSCELFSVSV